MKKKHRPRKENINLTSKNITLYLAAFIAFLLIFVSTKEAVFGGIGWAALIFAFFVMATVYLEQTNKWRSYGTKKITTIVVYLMLVLLLTGYAVNFLAKSQELRAIASIEPPDKKYGFDGIALYKIYWRMLDGDNYYVALDKAYTNDMRSNGILNSDKFGWRWPTLSWIWTKLPASGSGLIIWYMIFSASTLVASFLIGRLFVPGQFALAGASTLAPFWLFGGTSWWFSEPDIWVGFVLVWAIYFYLRGSYGWLPALLGLLAAAIREWGVLFIFAGLISELLCRRYKNAVWWFGGGLAYILLWQWHLNTVSGYLTKKGITVASGAVSRFHGFDPKVFLYQLTFGDQYYVGENIVLGLIIILCLASAIWLAWKKKKYLIAVIAGIYFVVYSFAASYPPDFTPGWFDYYAANWIPLLLPFSGIFVRLTTSKRDY